jgi:hypothetical protein
MVGKGKRPRDANQLAKWIVDRSTGQIEDTDPLKGKSPAAVERGRAGGLKGGKARAAKLTPEKRHEIARRAATERWKK